MTKPVCAEQRKRMAAAMSSTAPIRLRGAASAMLASLNSEPASRACAMNSRSIGVSIGPGATSLMRMPCSAASSAAVRVSMLAAALLALKFLLSLGHFGELGVGCWAALVLAAGLVAMTKRERDGETASRHLR